MDSQKKSNLADSAFHISKQEQDICRQVQARILQSTPLDNMGMSDSALTQLYWASRFYHRSCDSMILMLLFGNLTNVYLSLGELNRVDSVSRIALDLWNPLWKKRDSRLAILNNLAIAQATRGDMAKATTTFWQAYHEAETDSNVDYIQKALLNLGSIKGMTGDIDSAYYFFNIATINAKRSADIENYMSLLINLANLDISRGNPQHAIALLDSAYALAEARKSAEMLANVQSVRAELYAKAHDFRKAYDYQSDFIKIREKYLNEQRVKAVTDMMEKYESEKKVRQIQQLELEKLDATLENERIKSAKNRMTYIGVVVLLIAIALWSRLRYVRKSRTALQHEKDISEGLLLNILPGAVANELKEKGFTTAKHYTTATILFSDFKSFTEISEQLSATQLVDEINICFKAFDEIVTRLGIEKIKTLGDAYMAAGGITETTRESVLHTVLAGIEMQDFIIARKKTRDAQQLPAFEMRIGIHTGPVVAGIVGVKKFQYDLWGDTVNIASRMESTGESGRVNISEATYQMIKDTPSLRFTPRGMILAKGKGEMAMYFVEAV
jgi:class 3 adenylate cyclase